MANTIPNRQAICDTLLARAAQLIITRGGGTFYPVI